MSGTLGISPRLYRGIARIPPSNGWQIFLENRARTVGRRCLHGKEREGLNGRFFQELVIPNRRALLGRDGAKLGYTYQEGRGIYQLQECWLRHGAESQSGSDWAKHTPLSC